MRHLPLATCLLLVATLCSCLAYDSGSDTEDNDIASNNNIITDNSVQSDSEEVLEGDPCELVIWKPESEKDGNLALIFDAVFTIQFDSVQAVQLNQEGEIVSEDPEFLTFSSYDENGRQIWRGMKPGADYTGVFQVEYGTEFCQGEVKDPEERSE